MLKENLLRQGVDLAFETSLLYIDVNNGRLGVKTIVPNVDLDVNGIAVFNNALKINGANIISTQTNANIYLTPNGSGQVVTTSNLNLANITLSGNANVSYLNATYNVNARVLQSNVTTGTAPLTVNSTTQVANLNAAVAGSLVNGNSNVVIPSANGNVNINAVGNTTLVITGTGANISGTANISGNANVGNLGTATAVITTGNIATINSGLLQNGNSNVSITANSNVTITATSNATLVITSTGANISGTANVSGNANVGNIGTVNIVATGNANVTGNITGGNLVTSGSGGNISGANVVLANTFTSNVATGTAPFAVSSTTQVANLNVATAGNLINGTSNVIVTGSGNITVGSAGNAAIFTVTGTGANISGTANISGNANVGNLGTATAVITTGNITTVNSGLVQNGNSNVVITANANVTITSKSNATLVITSTGANISGTANISGNANVGNIGAGDAVLTSNIKIGGGAIKSSTGNTAITLADKDVTIEGNLDVKGLVTLIESTTVTINDKNLVLGNNANTSTTLDGGGIDLGDNALVTWRYNHSTTSWQSNVSVLPSANGSLTLGGTANYWGNAYVSNLLVSSGANVTGNANIGNIGTATIIASTANLTTINSGLVQNGTSNVTVNSSGNVNISVGGNVLTVTSTGAKISGTANVSGNANVGNLGTATAIITTGNITTVNSGLVQNGNSNVAITANSNVTITATSNATLVVTGTGANISGTAYVSGNANVGNIGTNTIVATAANVSGNANVGNISVGNVVMTANLTGANVIFANVFTANIATGTAPFAVSSTTQVANLNAAVAGNLINGTSNVVVTGSSNVTVSVAGNAAVFTVTGTGANISGTANVSGNANVGNLGTTGSITASSSITGGNIITAGYANIGNIAVNNVTISTLQTNANLNLDPNGVGSVVINSSGDASNLVVNGTTANLLYADAANNRIGVLTDLIPVNVAVKVNSTNSVILPVGNNSQRPGTPIQAMFRFNTDTTNYEFYDGVTWKQASSTFTTVSADEFTSDGSTRIYTLSQTSTTNATLVAVSGLIKIPAVDYSVSGSLLTFVTAPTAGQKIDIRVISTTTTVVSLSQLDTAVSVSDTGSNGTVTVTADGVERLVANSYVNANAAIVSRLAGTSVGAAAVVVDTFDKTLFRSAKYVVQVSNSGRGDYETSEYIATHNGTTAYGTSYGIVYSNVELGNVSVAVNSGNVELTYTGNFAGNTVKLFKEYIPV
jgi:hypothetical protein